ncbi:MAG TPA: MMPL family transporter [Methylomirabilota bacterium]|nr:MMPL family transporter [Methylomirabilota bacterium]
MATSPSSPAIRFLRWLAQAIATHRGWVLYPQLVLVALSVAYTVRHLEFHTDRSALVGGDKEYHRIYQEYKREFQVQDDLVVVVESEDMEKNRQFVERLGAKLESETNLFSGVMYKGDLRLLGSKALLFPPEAKLKDLLNTLKEYRPFLQEFSRATNLVSLFDLVNTKFRTAKREDDEQSRGLVKALPALRRIIDQATDALQREGNPPSPGINALFDGGREAEQAMYITFGNGRMYLVTAQARDRTVTPVAVRRLRALISETQTEVPGLNVGLTGEPVLEVDEMEQSQKDTTLASIVSLVLVALIFVYGYHSTGRPIKANLCLVAGLAYTMGYTTLTVGHLNVLTITFAPILIGLAIDFGVHLITRYEEELWHRKPEHYALEKAVVNTGVGIFTGAFTTAGAFFAMAFTDFDGIQEMGIICGGGLLVCLVPMMTLLPALLLGGRQNVLDYQLGPVLDRRAAKEVDQRARIENIWLRRPVTTLVVIAGISLLLVGPARKVGFDYNLLHMQSAGLPAVIFQDKLLHSSTKPVVYAVVTARSITEATNLLAHLTNLSTVASVDSLVGFLTEPAATKLDTLREIKALVGEIQFVPTDRAPVAVSDLNLSLFSLLGYARLAAEATRTNDATLHRSLTDLADAIIRLRGAMLMAGSHAVASRLAGFQQALFDDVRETFAAIRSQDASGPLTVEDLPAVLKRRFVSVQGAHALQVYPKKDVWERKEQEEFVAELRTVAPDVTGTPVQLLEYTTLLKQSYEEAALYSIAAIAVLILIHFRRLACVPLALLPVGLGWLWMVGTMGLTGVSFNPANIMTLPLIVGVGVTNGVHILNRFAEEKHPSILAKSTGKAVLVSGLTTIAGFGSLMLADHRGIRSLGFIMATGTATCMVVGLTALPAILNLLDRYGWMIKKTQRDNAQSTLGREEPR